METWLRERGKKDGVEPDLVALEHNRSCVKHDLQKMRSEKKDIYFKQLEHTKIIETEGIASKILSWRGG